MKPPSTAEEHVGSVALNIAIFAAFVRGHPRDRVPGRRAQPARRRTTTPRAARSPARRTAWRSPATTCRRRRSSGIAGAIAVNGYDGFLYSIGFLVAWLVALLLVAELLRNTGRYTMGDVLAFRMRQRPVRAAAATSTLVVSFFYLLAQMAGAGGLVALLLQIPAGDRLGQGVVIAVVGS